MTDNQPAPAASDVRVFVPAMDFEQSLRFYTRLGWSLNWKTDDGNLAELMLADCRFLLQNFYVKLWAENFVIHVTVADAAAWYDHVRRVLADDSFDHARVKPPFKEPHGAITTPVWDPSGVLINFSQFTGD